MAKGVTFEGEVFAALLTATPTAVDLTALDGGTKSAHVAATVAAMAAGAPLIIGGRLPDDTAGGRTGKPDLLVRGADRADGRPGYHPADVKHHLTLRAEEGSSATVSLPTAPARASAVTLPGTTLRWSEADCLQLAHYWRMLVACDFAADHPWGAVVGTDGPSGRIVEPLVLTWFDLSEPVFATFSRTHGKTLRSALERHDHEHAFRVAVAEVARQRTGAPTDPEPLVDIVGSSECDGCRWAAVCVDTLPADDLSGRLRGALSIREYLALRDAGIHTVADLAAANPDSLLDDVYRTETAHLTTRRTRLLKAHGKAVLAAAGVQVRRRPDPPAIPRADVEYDVDCEWDRSERVYLWGVLRTDAAGAVYTSFCDFDVADDAAEHDLTTRFLDWLADQIATDTGAGLSTAVFYYSPAETTRIARIHTAAGRPVPTGAADPAQWVDLLPLARATVDSLDGHGLKKLAVHGPGFAWRDEDPGGLQSQAWLEQARAGDADAAARLLAYNEDDVRATAALRAWL
ncbi:TM0106 family RecB-like putative nuclease [Geodermatophilus sp. SYSU D00815]